MKLCEMGMRVSPTTDGLWARATERLHAVDVATLPHPGFATDFMPLAVALMTVAEGSAIVTENVYDGRFQFVDELARMGADVRTEGRHAIVRGRRAALGRAGHAPPTCGPAPRSCSPAWSPTARPIVHDGEHVDRGYPDLAGQPPVPRRRRRAPRD